MAAYDLRKLKVSYTNTPQPGEQTKIHQKKIQNGVFYFVGEQTLDVVNATTTTTTQSTALRVWKSFPGLYTLLVPIKYSI